MPEGHRAFFAEPNELVSTLHRHINTYQGPPVSPIIAHTIALAHQIGGPNSLAVAGSLVKMEVELDLQRRRDEMQQGLQLAHLRQTHNGMGANMIIEDNKFRQQGEQHQDSMEQQDKHHSDEMERKAFEAERKETSHRLAVHTKAFCAVAMVYSSVLLALVVDYHLKAFGDNPCPYLEAVTPLAWFSSALPTRSWIGSISWLSFASLISFPSSMRPPDGVATCTVSCVGVLFWTCGMLGLVSLIPKWLAVGLSGFFV
jgi:hypothetical protein